MGMVMVVRRVDDGQLATLRTADPEQVFEFALKTKQQWRQAI